MAVSWGASMAVSGYNGRFIGWGGENIALWDPGRTERVWPFGSLPSGEPPRLSGGLATAGTIRPMRSA